MRRIFLLSPARSDGRRATMLTRVGADFELARRLQIGDVTIAEVFRFCSGLYFRGKEAYARRFADPEAMALGIHVITSSRGIVAADLTVGPREMEEFAAVPVDVDEPAFAGPLRESVARLAADTTHEIVLLGSVATGKYVDVLLPELGERLLFPRDFIGRGDMSRGGLMLRRAASGDELEYIPVLGAIRRGRRAAKIGAFGSGGGVGAS
jgi:hypothetical protein